MRNDRVIHDLQDLPRVEDGWTFLYTEKARVERENAAIELVDKDGRVSVPIAALSVLVLGPGTVITHAAMVALAECGCSVVWSGDSATRFYASGLGETRKATNLMAQAKAWSDADEHLEVVMRMYRLRFPEGLPAGLTIEQIRGREGVRVREAYARAATEFGIEWKGRNYRAGEWDYADPVNRALSAANACLYAFCASVISATGFSTGLGFVHTGKMLSFAYDIADLYKVDVTVPAAFKAAALSREKVESRVRAELRELFWRDRLVERIVPDIQRVLGLKPEAARAIVHRIDDARPQLWDPKLTVVDGGKSFGPDAMETTKRASARQAMTRSRFDRDRGGAGTSVASRDADSLDARGAGGGSTSGRRRRGFGIVCGPRCAGETAVEVR